MDIIVKPIETFRDNRGTIELLLTNFDFSSVLKLESKKGAIRANHWHKKDYHLCVLISGSMNYYERPVGSKEKPTKVTLIAGVPFFTQPGVEHAMEFLEDSVFYCFSKLSRNQSDYETDTIRLDFDLTQQ